MGVRFTDWVWSHGPKDRGERMVLLAIADRANDHGEAFPSMAGIADRCCMTERGARKIVRRLEVDGWIETRVGGGRGGKSVYRVQIDRNPELRTGNDVANPEPETGNVGAITRNQKPGIGKNPEPECRKPGTGVPPNRKEPSSSSSSARDASADDLYDQVLAAVGITNGIIPTRWMPPAATIHVGKWRADLGLTADEIIATAHESRKRHDTPPDGPKALDRAMERTAGAKSVKLSPAKSETKTSGPRPVWEQVLERGARSA